MKTDLTTHSTPWLKFFGDEDTKKLVRRLYQDHMRSYKTYFLLSILFMIFTACSTVALAYLLQPVFDEVLQAKNLNRHLFFCSCVFLSFTLKGFSAYGEMVTLSYVGQKIISDIQNRLFKHLLKADLAFFHNMSSGQLLSRFSNDIHLMRGVVTNTIINIGKDTLTLFFLVALMFQRDWKLASATFVIFPLALLPITKIGRKIRKMTHDMQNELGRLLSRLTQVFQGVRTVKAYNCEEIEEKHTQEIIERIFQVSHKSIRIRSISYPIIETFAGIAIASVLVYGGFQVIHESKTAGAFLSFIGAIILAYEPLKRLSNMNANLQEGLASAMRVFSLLDTLPEVKDPAGRKKFGKVKGPIVFEEVGFSYPDGTQALQDIHLTIHPGQTCAFVGLSGAGKSTFINLIPRFYDVTSGRILIEGQDIRDFSLKSLREQIALVSQEVTLFDTTILENITYGQKEVPFEEVVKAATAAAAHDFIKDLPQGYHSLIGENGVKLSGGQRQRVAIARAMLKNAPILLLDEATSALDTDSERQVQTALKRLMEGRTTISVAHRLSTIIDADVIYVLDKGKVSEVGNHQTLLKLNKIYANLWKQQSESREH